MRISLAAISLLALQVLDSSAFLAKPSLTHQRCSTPSISLYGMFPRETPNDDFGDIDLARIRLEAMMGTEDSSGNNAVKERTSGLSSLPPPPPLTSIGRDRCMAEIKLLGALGENDDALSDLWSLWFAERGPRASAQLMQAEELTELGPRSWDKAEQLLRQLIDEHTVYWAEPANRLATLLYMQGRFQESKELCETVLTVKPWHFGALSGIVLACAAMGDVNSARQWATRRLPPIQPTGSNRRRTEWVMRAVEDSRAAVKLAEARVKASFGKPDKLPKKRVDPPRSIDMDDGAWQ